MNTNTTSYYLIAPFAAAEYSNNNKNKAKAESIFLVVPVAVAKKVKAEVKAVDLAKEVKPHVATSFEVGAILSDCWGWEQTNYDFYVITKVTKTTVTIQAMTQTREYNGAMMTSKNMPAKIDLTQKPIRKKLKYDREGNATGFSLRDYMGGGWCKLWNGKAEHASHYA